MVRLAGPGGVAAAVLVAAVVLTALTACGSGHSTPHPSPSVTRSADILAIGLRYSACIRSHGSPQYPDMIVRNGQLMLPPGHNSKTTGAAVTAGAEAACRHILASLPPGAMYKGDRPPAPDDLPKLVDFAKCMRAQGIAGFPDPKPDGSFPLSGTPLPHQLGTTRLKDARKACQRYWDGELVQS